MAKAGSEAGKTEHDIQAGQLPWEAMPNLLSWDSGAHAEEECRGHRVRTGRWVRKSPPSSPEPYYCPCSRNLDNCTTGRYSSEGFGQSGISFRKMRNMHKAAHIVSLCAVAIVLPLALIVQCLHVSIFGSNESPSVVWGLIHYMSLHWRVEKWLDKDVSLGINGECAWKWFEENWRRIVVACIPMFVPIICFVAAAVLGCPWRDHCCPSKPYVSAGIFLLLPCGVVSWVLFEAWPSLVQICSRYLYAQHSKAAKTSSKASVTVRTTFVNNPVRIVLY